MWKFKNYQFESRVANTGNQLSIVVAVVAHDKILVINVLARSGISSANLCWIAMDSLHLEDPMTYMWNLCFL